MHLNWSATKEIQNYQILISRVSTGCGVAWLKDATKLKLFLMVIVYTLHFNSLQKSALECLEVMYINNVLKLASIWEGLVQARSLARLKSLTLCKCLSLKMIFSNGMIGQLFKLQNLKVEECFEIKEIIIVFF